MIGCDVNVSLTNDPTTGNITLLFTDSNGNILPVTDNLKPLINQCIAQFGVIGGGGGVDPHDHNDLYSPLGHDHPEYEDCHEEVLEQVEFLDGPGNPNSSATAAAYYKGVQTHVCVINADTGQEAMYWIVKDYNGNPQWRQDDQ